MSGSGGLYSGLDVEGVDTAVPDANASQSSRPASSRSFMPAALRRKGKVRNLAHLRPSPAPRPLPHAAMPHLHRVSRAHLHLQDRNALGPPVQGTLTSQSQSRLPRRPLAHPTTLTWQQPSRRPRRLQLLQRLLRWHPNQLHRYRPLPHPPSPPPQQAPHWHCLRPLTASTPPTTPTRTMACWRHRQRRQQQRPRPSTCSGWRPSART